MVMTVGRTGTAALSAAAVAEAEAAQILQDRVDVLLDRLTDRILDAPAAGSARWLQDFREAPTPPHVRQQMRAAILTAAGFTAPTPPHTQTSRRGGRVDPAQLTMF